MKGIVAMVVFIQLYLCVSPLNEKQTRLCLWWYIQLIIQWRENHINL